MEGDRDGMEDVNNSCCVLCAFGSNGHRQPRVRFARLEPVWLHDWGKRRLEDFYSVLGDAIICCTGRKIYADGKVVYGLDRPVFLRICFYWNVVGSCLSRCRISSGTGNSSSDLKTAVSYISLFISEMKWEIKINIRFLLKTFILLYVIIHN